MALCRFGQGVVVMAGSVGGVYYHRDKSGSHCCSHPRKVKMRSPAQAAQRNAFARARAFSTDNRVVSYLIYRALNNLPFLFDTKVTGNPTPDCTGTYVITGQHNGEDYYRRADSAWFIWWDGFVSWNISQEVGVLLPISWFRLGEEIVGNYLAGGGAAGTATVGLHLQPPPLDYQIPHLQEPKNQ